MKAGLKVNRSVRSMFHLPKQGWGLHPNSRHFRVERNQNRSNFFLGAGPFLARILDISRTFLRFSLKIA